MKISLCLINSNVNNLMQMFVLLEFFYDFMYNTNYKRLITVRRPSRPRVLESHSQ